MAEQHVQYFRKIALRRNLLRWASDGPAYVPFIGDGDIASDLYRDRTVYGADIDPVRVDVAAKRLRSARVIEADCDGWPFPELAEPVAVADFDAYAYPYASFRAFWAEAPKADRHYIRPDGEHVHIAKLSDRRRIHAFYLVSYIWPWFEQHVAPWRVLHRFRYLRGWMAYWGAVIER